MSEENRDNISILIRERGKVKSSLTRFKTFMHLAIPGSDKLTEISVRLQVAETLLDKFNSIQDTIDNLVDDDGLVAEEIERFNFENDFYEIISKARSVLDNSRESVAQVPSENNLHSQISNNRTTVKLPVIDLPSFDGSHEQYLYFRDVFDSLINKNDSLAPVQKFHYLRAALKGRARDIVQNLELSAANYNEAWTLIRNRYDNNRLLSTNHIKEIFNLQALQKESYHDLRELLDNFQKHLRALKVLKKPIDHWDCPMVYLISTKLDPSTRRQWEEESLGSEEPTVAELIKFLNNKCQILETLHNSNKPSSKSTHKNKAFVAVNVNNTPSCSKCKGKHYIQNCEQFLSLSPDLRSKELQTLRLCLNCLRPGHWSKVCKAGNCRKCGRKHNTLIHFSPTNSDAISNKNTRATEQIHQIECVDMVSNSYMSHNSQSNCQTNAFLSTAVVKVADKDGHIHTSRVLLDNGSESNFITERLCNKLGIKKSKVNFSVTGINVSHTQISHCAQIKIMSRVNSYSKVLSCLVIPKITEKIPSVPVIREFSIPNNIKLADPTFNIPGDIDLLIGVNMFYELQSIGQIFLQGSSMRLQKTLLGWIVSGPIFPGNNILCNLAVNKKRDNESGFSQINKSRELEEVDCSSNTHLSQGELFCEDNFVQTTTRSETGQFIVTLPLNKRIYDLGDSKTMAVNRFLSLERKFQKDANLKKTIRDILLSGGFHLRKWASNNPEILNEFPANDSHELINLSHNSEQIKTLGIGFNTCSDAINYSVNLRCHPTVSKRTILSNIASIFDPLGLLSPVIVKAKLMMQTLWKMGVSWDESLPTNTYSEWLHFKQKLRHLDNIEIPRKVICDDAVKVELHGFADSSERAYASCIYIRSQASDRKWQVNLLCAKTKVAPLKKTTLPRLELCAAVLLSKLVKKVRHSIEIDFDRIYLWTDSLITLSWIRGEPHRWQTFVANRVAQIQDISKIDQWHYINSKNNPADCATRGINASDLITCNLWWHVPWLTIDRSEWPVPVSEQIEFQEIPDVKKTFITTVMVATNEDDFSLFDRYSSLDRLLRVTAYILRFYFNSKEKSKAKTNKLSVDELNRAETFLVRVIQKRHFPSEISRLSHGNAVNKQSKILSLSPFLDIQNVLRVGGRLSESNFSFDKKHPILLPKHHPFTDLVFRHYHIKSLHSGPQTLLYLVRERFWPISGKYVARKIVRDCVTCFRVNPKPNPYLMGQLPNARVEGLPPFTNTGIDFGGPFPLKNKSGRGSRIVKCYICLFVCLCTRAIHLELVLDLTTDGFLSALKRFFARRGKSTCIFSDNGRNFVGANKELAKILNSVSESNLLSNNHISWHFIPPHAPNFGGIWEAGIKSAKHHLKRVVGNLALTYDEFITVLSQVEAVLNSRPLSPLSENPNDLTPLTPGHFLIGRPLTSTPDHELVEIPQNRLSKYQRMQQIVQRFWKRWSVEYVSQLQVRTKWKTESSTRLKIGDLVLIRDDNLPPLRWALGHIKETHPGSDGIVRVVSIQCSDTVIKRPVSKICVLPFERNMNECPDN